MSYILDALNKSDQAREKEQAPSLASVHRQRAQQRSEQKKWLTIVVVITLLNISGFAAWQLLLRTPDTASAPDTGTTTTTAALPAASSQTQSLQTDPADTSKPGLAAATDTNQQPKTEPSMTAPAISVPPAAAPVTAT
ncbi:MAG: hypothetical protein KDI36_14320, partial [Pseudomonadales bacterium]|nr:hypothetical protein [Pseudomonadales bacterium]